MFAISPAHMNIYQLKQIPISANINADNFDHVIAEWNIDKSDIQCWLYHTYTNKLQKRKISITYANIKIGIIP